MGLTNFQKYRITVHAKQRYRERISPGASERGMMKHFTTLMQGAEFKDKEEHGCESWLHRGQDIVLIVDPSKHTVVTVFHAIRDVEPRERAIDPAQRLVAEAARRLYLDEEKRFWERLAPLYAAYADKMGRMSRVKRSDYRDRGRRELDRLRDQIRRLEQEKHETLTGLQEYRLQENPNV